MTNPADAIGDFYRQDDLVEAFIAEMQSGEDAWSSCLDHAGRLVLIDPHREVYAIQPGERDGFDAVSFTNLSAAFDAEAVVTDGASDEYAEARRISNDPTPRAAFEALCRHVGLDLDMEPPSP